MADEEGSWASFTNPPKTISQLMILQAREGFELAMRENIKRKIRGQQLDLSDALGWLYKIHLDIIAMYGSVPELRVVMVEAFNDTDMVKIQDAWEALSAFLYKKGLTKWDTKGGYDTTHIEEANRANKY